MDLETFGRPVELFGSHDSDEHQWLDLILLPCDEAAPGCRINDFKDSNTGIMNTEALWDEIGLPVLEIVSKEGRIEQDDPYDPLKTETIFNRSYLKMYTPTWGHNKLRVNKFTDSRSVWVPFPTGSQDAVTFFSMQHNEDMHRSAWMDYETGRYKFTSYEIFVDLNINQIERSYDTLLNLISEIGSIKTGLMLIFGLLLSSWQRYSHDHTLASTLLLERK